jgi:hypothetical protein
VRPRKPARAAGAWLADLQPLLDLQFPAPPEYDPDHPERAGVTFWPDGEWNGVIFTGEGGRYGPERLRVDAEMAAHLAVSDPDPTYRRALAEHAARRLAASENAADRWAAWVLATLLAADLGATPPPAGLPHRTRKSLTVTRGERARRRKLIGVAWLDRDRTHPEESDKARIAALAELGVMPLKAIEAIVYSAQFRHELYASRYKRDLLARLPD